MQHLKMQHNLPYVIVKLSFDNMEAFREWRAAEERDKNAMYVQNTGVKKIGNVHHTYLYCNRSGAYEPKGQGKRFIKSQGTCKIGEVCTSYMKVCQNVDSGRVSVEYCGNHRGHQCMLAHLRIPEDVRSMIAAKLQLGVDIGRILDDIRGGVSENDSIGREHLIERRDVLNIKRKLNIGSIEKHSNDHTSVCAWVEELRTKRSTPILLFKPQGIECQESNIGKDDFLLVFQTEFQRDILKQYGNDVICMDATHGTNMYDFQLISVLVVDSFGEGVPVAWAISNHENAVHITEFLTAIKKSTGDLSPKVFMSDDADQYFNSWCAVFSSQSTKKLLCAWHIDRAWRKGLSQHISEFQTRIEVYHQLRVILMETQEVTFRLRMQQLLSYLLESQPRFCEYFQREYACSTRISQWAMYHRSYAGINTNMRLESFHRKLKVCYLQKKQNRRIDALLNVLMRIARDLVFESIIKQEKGKQTHAIHEIKKRHESAEEMAVKGMEANSAEEGVWTVSSESDPNNVYYVKQIKDECSCKLSCVKCGACVHMFTCSCIDSAIHSTVCKHIHLLQITSNPQAVSTSTIPETVVTSDTAQLYVDVIESTSSVKQKITTNLQLLSNLLVLCDNQETLHAVSNHISSAISVMKASDAYSTTELNIRKRPAPNENHEKQPRFYSTKKKRQKSVSLSKPSPEEEMIAQQNLETTDVCVCSLCFKVDDGGADEIVNWTRCCHCSLWYHSLCVGVESESFMCKLCEKEQQN